MIVAFEKILFTLRLKQLGCTEIYDIFCFNFNYNFFKEPGDEGLIFVHLILNCLIIRTSFHGNIKDVFATISSLHAILRKRLQKTFLTFLVSFLVVKLAFSLAKSVAWRNKERLSRGSRRSLGGCPSTDLFKRVSCPLSWIKNEGISEKTLALGKW